jgi:hypothetical protein
LIEHILLILKVSIASLVNDVPEQVLKAEKKRKYQIKKAEKFVN